MFDFLPEIAKELHTHTLGMYWSLVLPTFLFSLISEFFQLPDGKPNPLKVFNRLLISVFLLLSFNYTMDLISIFGDGVSEKIDGIKQLWTALEEIGNKFSSDSNGGWFQVRSTIVYIMGLLSYFIAYLGVFVSNALIHFVWSILYICSPLMILAYINEKSSYVTTNLYKGLINVVLWKIMASILGVLMLKLLTSNQVGQDWTTSFSFVAINLCIGLSLLFVPMTTKSLLGDGLTSMASGLAAAPAYVAAGSAKIAAKASVEKTKNSALFAARPATNLFNRKIAPITNKISDAKQRWNDFGKDPKEKKNQYQPWKSRK